MGIVGRLDQYASMLSYEFDETTANNMSITGLGTYYSSEFNENIVDIVRDGLVLNLDAGNLASYPGIGNTWTDLSGNNKNATLVGDEISYLNVNGGVFNFTAGPASDGDSDYFSLPNTSFILGANFTIEVWTYYNSVSQPGTNPWDGGCLYTNSAESDWSSGAGNDNGLLFGYNSIVYRNTSSSEILVLYSPAPTTRVWHQHVLVVNSGTGRVYVDNVQVATLSNMRTYTQSNGTLGIGIADKSGLNYRGEYLGYISSVKVYTKALTASEVQQNYNTLATRFGLSTTNSTAPMSANISAPYDLVYDEFGGTLFGAGQGRYMRQNTDKSVIVYNEIDEVTDFRDIVRSGLVLDLDAGMNASFNNTGTTWTDLSGIGNNGTLTGGPTYSSANGGSIVFDGTDDYVDTGKTATQLGIYDADYTFDAWVYPTNLNSDKTMFGTDQTVGRQGLHLVFRGGVIYQGHYSADFSAGSATINAWNNISYTYVKSSSSASIYKNGVLQGSGTIASFIGTTNILLGRWGTQYYFIGNGSNYKIYNRALSAAEITQNYNALKHRFGL